MAAFHFFPSILPAGKNFNRGQKHQKLSIDSRSIYIYSIKYGPLGGAISNLSYFFEPLYETAKQKFFKAKICKKMTCKYFLPIFDLSFG